MRSQRQEFISNGLKLAAKLDAPDGDIRAYALFAHCFTCGKDAIGAHRLAQSLAAHGIAVLRFDFTGLGGSEGDFADTNFSSNVADLVAAADFLRTQHAAPQLLIGHSLGGTAMLAAAEQIAEATAVVTIGSPSDPTHMPSLFGSKYLELIRQEGEAMVPLAGRPFRIKRQFFEDAEGYALKPKIAGLKRALLVIHAPGDDTVPVANAMEIVTAARHPKSFVSLDTADHLLTRREDAVYVADLIAAWSRRYLA